MYIRVLCTIIYQSDDLALSASDTCSASAPVSFVRLRPQSLTAGSSTRHSRPFACQPAATVSAQKSAHVVRNFIPHADRTLVQRSQQCG